MQCVTLHPSSLHFLPACSRGMPNIYSPHPGNMALWGLVSIDHWLYRSAQALIAALWPLPPHTVPNPFYSCQLLCVPHTLS